MKDKSKVLYLGLDPDRFEKEVFHFPIIEIKPFNVDSLSSHQKWTYIILTSRIAVGLFFAHCKKFDIDLSTKFFLLIGSATVEKLKSYGSFQYEVAVIETSEGMNELIAEKEGYFFYPHSARSRGVILDFLKQKKKSFEALAFYDTVATTSRPLPPWQDFEEIVFTSPSCVDAFWELYGVFPENKKLTAIGPITQKKLDCFIKHGLL